MKSWTRPLSFIAVIGVVAGAYLVGRIGRSDSAADNASQLPPDPGYAARDAEVIETGFDGRERYRLKARVIRQQIDSSVIDIEELAMAYHPDAQAQVPGETATTPAGEVWHLSSAKGEVRDNGDDVQLSGNVNVTGAVPGTGAPLSLVTETLRINTPTEFIETDAPVKINWSGHELTAVGLQADLKAGSLRLESQVHGEFAPH